MSRPTASIPSDQQRAFGLALAEYLGINPERFVLRGWETFDRQGYVDLRALIPADDLLFMFNEGRVPGGKPCSSCGKTGGPWPNGDRPYAGPMASGCARCGWCF